MDTIDGLRVAADRILALHEEGDLEAALRLADEVAAAALTAWERDPRDPVARESLFVARFERGMVLVEMDLVDEAADAFGAAADTPIDPEDPDQRHEIAMALLHRGMCLDQAGDPAGAIAAYGSVVERFAGAEDAVTRDQVVRARVNRAAALLGADDAEGAMGAADEVRQELDPSLPLDAEQWLLATRIQAAALVRGGRQADARAVLEAAVDIDLDDPAVVEQRELASVDLADLLDHEG